MLILRRGVREGIRVRVAGIRSPLDILVTKIDRDGHSVKLGFEGPRDFRIFRDEIDYSDSGKYFEQGGGI